MNLLEPHLISQLRKINFSFARGQKHLEVAGDRERGKNQINKKIRDGQKQTNKKTHIAFFFYLAKQGTWGWDGKNAGGKGSLWCSEVWYRVYVAFIFSFPSPGFAKAS